MARFRCRARARPKPRDRSRRRVVPQVSRRVALGCPGGQATVAAPLAVANLEHDFAALPAGRNPLERRPGLGEPEDRVDFRAKLACVH